MTRATTGAAIERLRDECQPNGQSHFASITKADGRLILEALSAPPMGEATLYGCADGNGIDPRLVFRGRDEAEALAADLGMTVQPLYALAQPGLDGAGEAMREALKPFATLAEWFHDAEYQDTATVAGGVVSVGDLRRARDAFDLATTPAIREASGDTEK